MHLGARRIDAAGVAAGRVAALCVKDGMKCKDSMPLLVAMCVKDGMTCKDSMPLSVDEKHAMDLYMHDVEPDLSEDLLPLAQVHARREDAGGGANAARGDAAALGGRGCAPSLRGAERVDVVGRACLSVERGCPELASRTRAMVCYLYTCWLTLLRVATSY